MSPTELVLTILGAVGGTGVIVAGIGAWLGKVWADRIAQTRKLAGDIDLDLRVRRIDLYGEIWEATAVLPRWPPAQGVTYDQLYGLSQTLRTWYFHRGGMYLSRRTHDGAYSTLQETLADVLSRGASGPISEADYERVRHRCSALRTALANDIESRRDAPL